MRAVVAGLSDLESGHEVSFEEPVMEDFPVGEKSPDQGQVPSCADQLQFF